MAIVRIVWTIFWNLIVVAIFLGMLNVATTNFETIMISGLALIYVTIIYYGAASLRTQLAHSRMSAEHFIWLARNTSNADAQQEISEIEADVHSQWAEYEAKTVHYWINMGFNSLIWLIAVFSIVRSL